MRQKRASLAIVTFPMLVVLTCPSARAETYRPLEHLETGFKSAVSPRYFALLTAGTAATLGTLPVDDDVGDYFTTHKPLGKWADYGNFMGSGIPTVALGAGLLTYGLLSRAEREAQAGTAVLEAELVNFVVTTILKATVRRERPDGSNRESFASGHASTTFATAGTMLALYGPAVGMPLLGVGAWVSLSRIESNKHYLSDTIFGATVGFIVGHAFAQHHRTDEEDRFLLTPYFSEKGTGLQARVSF